MFLYPIISVYIVHRNFEIEYALRVDEKTIWFLFGIFSEHDLRGTMILFTK